MVVHQAPGHANGTLVSMMLPELEILILFIHKLE